MAVVTIAMPARNAAKFIRQAISSIRQQTDTDWELFVVDDASEDETANVVRAFDDARITLLTNETQCGIWACHNRILESSHAPYIAHIDADDFILPGALRKMVHALENNSRAGLAHCQFYDVDEQGVVRRDIFLQRAKLYEQRARGFDYRRELLAQGTVTSGLRTYPRRVLDELGGFNETVQYGGDLEMALRIVEHGEIAFVPEFLYARRLHAQNTTESLSFKSWRYLWQRFQMCRALSRSRQVTYFHHEPYNLHRLLLTGLADTLGIPRAQAFVSEKIFMLPRQMRAKLSANIATPLRNSLYEFAVNHGAWWRLHWRTRPRARGAPKRIGYYKWRFPDLSETFILREVNALRDAGMNVEMFADEPGGLESSPHVATTHYLMPRDAKRIARAKSVFKRRARLRYWNVFLYTVLHRYGEYKTWHEDWSVFECAVDLALHLNEYNVSYLHAPWADRTAFIAMLAAALLDIPYSVQGRAHDLHRHKFQFGLREKFSNAAFVITNSDYNARTIKTYLDTRNPPPLRVIRNLFPLEQFQPRTRSNASPMFQILCVARLIEEKGLVYLMHACADLRARGVPFCCEIIGAPEEPTYINYWLQLKHLHQKLQLQNCVSFRGAQPFENILDAYARADLFVLPCVLAENGGRDISPNSLIEAMAMGLPVISTQFAAIPEIVEQGVSGILVPPNDANALADAMAQLLNAEPLRRALGARARERVEARYDARKNVAQFVEMFSNPFGLE